jgi:hypothetical protein
VNVILTIPLCGGVFVNDVIPDTVSTELLRDSSSRNRVSASDLSRHKYTGPTVQLGYTLP